jgi:hypothetical protein
MVHRLARRFVDLLYSLDKPDRSRGFRLSQSKKQEDTMGANHSGERRKRRMKRSRRNLVTQEKAAQASSAKKRKKKA